LLGFVLASIQEITDNPIRGGTEREVGMSRLQVDASKIREVVLIREDRACPRCGATMHIRCCRTRILQTLQGPLRLIVKLVQCPKAHGEQAKTFAPEQEFDHAMPRWAIGWDVFCWIGHRRFSRHWSVSQIRHELADSYHIQLSEDAIEDHLVSYQSMVAARHQDAQEMKNAYRDTGVVVLTIDGLQPEKGHETLYVVREVTRRRVWFAEPLLSGATDEIRKLFVRAKRLAESLNLKTALWISDKQDAFLKCVAEEFSGVPHRYCENHFFRDLAKPVLDMDSTAKKKMRGKIRGLRAIEREVLQAQPADASPAMAGSENPPERPILAGESGRVVLDYCSVVRGVLNDNHGGPCHPAGMRMLEALGDVQASLNRVVSSEKAGPAFGLLKRLKGFLDRGVASQQETFTRVREYTDQVRQVRALLTDPEGPPVAERESQFVAKIEVFQQFADERVYSHFAKVMTSFRPGLFAGAEMASYPRDNLDLERWFRSPKSHERRLHGHRHAGIRIVREGPTLALTLDAHALHPGVFTREDLFPFRRACPPASQLASQHRHGIMRKSRSKKNDSSC
jgi:hypothetical protein